MSRLQVPPYHQRPAEDRSKYNTLSGFVDFPGPAAVLMELFISIPFMNWVFSLSFLWELLNKALAEECQGCLSWIVEQKPFAQWNSDLQNGEGGMSEKTTPILRRSWGG